MEDKPCVLIVDDYEGIRDSLSAVMRRAGYDTEVAGTCREALEKVRTRFFNVTLLDIMLPDGDGLEALASLRAIQPDIAVVVITGHSSMDAVVRALNEGASAFITKPFDMDTVDATVKEALGKQQLVMENRRLYREAKQELAERRKAEESLREREKEVRCILDGSYDVVYRLNLKTGAYDYVSPSALRVFGHSPEEIMAAGFEAVDSLVHPDDREIVKRDNHRLAEYALGLAKECSAVTTDYRLQRDETEYRWLSDTRSLLFDEGGTPVAVVGIMRDITERKQAEEALRKSEEKYKFLYEGSGAISLIIGMDGRVMDANRTALEKFGYSREEDAGKPALDLVVPEDREKAADVLAKAFRGEYTPEIDLDIYAKDGSIHTVLLSEGQLVLHDQGQPTGILVTGLDITERKKAEEALRRSEEVSRIATRLATDLVYERDMRTGIATYYGDMDAKLGYGRGEYPRTVEGTIEHIHPEDMPRFFELSVDDFNAGEPMTVEYRKRKKDGSYAHWLDRFALVRDEATGRPVRLVGVATDITERKRALEALTRSEEKYRGLVESAAAGIASTDLTGNVTYVNQAFCKMTGYSAEELVGRPFAAYLHPEDADRVVRVFLNAVGGARTRPIMEFRVVRKDGQACWCHTCPTALEQEGGGVMFTAIIHDVTQRKIAEERLRESEQRFRLASQIANDLVYERDVRTGVATYYGDIDGHMGYGPGEFPRTAEGWMAHIRPEDSRRLVDQMGEQAERGEPFTVEYRMTRKDGEDVYWLDRFATIWDADTGEAAKLLGVATDVTDRMKADERLRQSEQNYRVLFESTMDGLVVIDAETMEVVLANRSAARMHGFDTLEEAGVTGADRYFLPSDRDELLRAIRDDVLEKDTRQVRELRTVGRDGKVLWISGVGTRIEYQGRPAALFSFRDVTERRETEERLRDYRQQLRSLASRLSLVEQRERRRLAAGLHDRIGQSLAVIKLKLGALRETASTAEFDRRLGEIRAHVEQVIGDTRSLTFELSPPILYELGLEAALEWLAEEFQKRHGISCELRDDGKEKPLGDDVRGMLFQAANELLLNVAKHAQAQAVTISVERLAHEIEVTVEDDGAGFEPVGDGRRSRGFGLFNIRERLEQIGGRVDIKSRPGRGTRVTMAVPLERKARAKRGD